MTTVRASTPMYLLSRKIKAMGVKMVLSGEGSDEIFGGAERLRKRGEPYVRGADPSFHRQDTCISTPRPIARHSTRNVSVESKTSIRPTVCVPTSEQGFVLPSLIQRCRQFYRSTMAWGLEARVPFLDKTFLEVAMNIDPKEKLFSKGTSQEVDQDGLPKMEKVD